jgi:hypothetical protein
MFLIFDREKRMNDEVLEVRCLLIVLSTFEHGEVVAFMRLHCDELSYY